MQVLMSVTWTVLGQGLAALGLLLGQRWLTGMVTPQVYGELTLVLGVAGLAVNAFTTPFVQAAIHAYPSSRDLGSLNVLKQSLTHLIGQSLSWLSLVMLSIGGTLVWADVTTSSTIVLVVLLVVMDSLRAASQAMLNAEERHLNHALWTTADTWLRAMIAVAAVYLFGNSITVVMGAYLVAAAAFLPWVVKTLPIAGDASDTDESLRQQMWTYALPLVPLGLTGWVNGLADRYVIGASLSMVEVGIYAAAAGLASRPMLMLGTAIELVMRPRYQQAVSAANRAEAKQELLTWLLAICITGGLVVIMLSEFHQQVAKWLLGPEFRSGSSLMPWIAGGYWMLIMSYVFERVCYAHGCTTRVLAIQTGTAALAVICLFIGAKLFGLVGAAMAIPVYCGGQLLFSILHAQWTLRFTDRLVGDVHAV